LGGQDEDRDDTQELGGADEGNKNTGIAQRIMHAFDGSDMERMSGMADPSIMKANRLVKIQYKFFVFFILEILFVIDFVDQYKSISDK